MLSTLAKVAAIAIVGGLVYASSKRTLKETAKTVEDAAIVLLPLMLLNELLKP